MAQLFYRIVKTSPPMLADFQSHVALGKLPITSDPTTRRMAEGISVFATLSQARRNARSFPAHGGFIAELSIPDLAPLTVARTGRQPGHHTIWGEPDELLGYVVSVTAVSAGGN